MDTQEKELLSSITAARSQERLLGLNHEATQDRFMEVFEKLEALGRADARHGVERDMGQFKIDAKPYHEAYADEKESKKDYLGHAADRASAFSGRDAFSAVEAQAGQRYSGAIVHVSKEHIAQLHDKHPNQVVVHDRERIDNSTSWAAEGKQATISYSPGGIGIAKQQEKALEHQGREAARDHAVNRDMSLGRE